jgi:hypothetical protein
MKCRDVLGVEPICKALPVVLSNCHDRHAIAQDTDKASAMANPIQVLASRQMRFEIGLFKAEAINQIGR